MKFLSFSLICLTAFIHSQALRLRGETYPRSGSINTSVPVSKRYQTLDSRIVADEIAPKGYAPWQVSLQNQNGSHFCGGSIIADRYVVTAAKCLLGLDVSNVKVVTGTNDLKNLGREYQVEEIFIHCNFHKQLYRNDVGLLKVKNDFLYDEETKSATLAELDEMEEGETLSMTGYGISQLGQNYSEQLKMWDMKLISTDLCRSMYGKYAADIDDSHLCVLPKKRSRACHGDNGGPLVNSQVQLVGVSNLRMPCARGFPAVYAKLSYYNDWIRTTIKGCRLRSQTRIV